MGLFLTRRWSTTTVPLQTAEQPRQGLREEQEEGLCYAGVPSCRYTNEGTRRPPPKRKTFLVFVTKDGNVFQWRWEEADPNMEGYPLKWRERFGSQKWPKA